VVMTICIDAFRLQMGIAHKGSVELGSALPFLIELGPAVGRKLR
jgi:hypothetical protein